MQRSHAPSRSPLFAAAATLLALASSACTTLVGNVKPVEEKSSTYRVMNLSTLNADWKRLEQPPGDAETDPHLSNAPDVVYQSSFTGSTVSMNSACRASLVNSSEPLDKLLRVLLLGVGDVVESKDTVTQVDGVPALGRVVSGRIQGQPVKIQALVTRKGECIYDLMYVARPERFQERQEDFAKFIASLRLR